MDKAKAVLPDITYCADPYQAAKGADAIVIVTEWSEFRQIDWERMRSSVGRALIIDGRNALEMSEATRHGFHYVSIGRASAIPRGARPAGYGAPSDAGGEGLAADLLAS
jgi:UDPglucose 6-dehydrogenase